jgi:hypothetical protein
LIDAENKEAKKRHLQKKVKTSEKYAPVVAAKKLNFTATTHSFWTDLQNSPKGRYQTS